MLKLQLQATCVGNHDTDALEIMAQHDREITYKTFARHVDIRSISELLGYAYDRGQEGMRLSQDYAVRFYRSVWKGKPCYHMDWSRIDHIFQ